jgi:hypothetical protein
MKHEIVCRAFNTERLRDFDVSALPDGQALAYLYYEDEPARRSVAELPTRGEGHATDSVRNCLRHERNAR